MHSIHTGSVQAI